jgi:hypothetical protein
VIIIRLFWVICLQRLLHFLVRPPISIRNAAALPAEYVQGCSVDDTSSECISGSLFFQQRNATVPAVSHLPPWLRGPDHEQLNRVQQPKKRPLLVRYPLSETKRKRLEDFFQPDSPLIPASPVPTPSSVFVKKEEQNGKVEKKRERDMESVVAISGGNGCKAVATVAFKTVGADVLKAPVPVPSNSSTVPRSSTSPALAGSGTPAANSISVGKTAEYESVDLSSYRCTNGTASTCYVSKLLRHQQGRLPTKLDISRFMERERVLETRHLNFLWIRDTLVDDMYFSSQLQSLYTLNRVNESISDPQMITECPELDFLKANSYLPCEGDDEKVIPSDVSDDLKRHVNANKLVVSSRLDSIDGNVLLLFGESNVDGLVRPQLSVSLPMKRESEYRGVLGQPGSHRWCAVLPKSPLFAVGCYDTELEAAAAHDSALRASTAHSAFQRYVNFTLTGQRNILKRASLPKSFKRFYSLPYFRPSKFASVRAHGKCWVAFSRTTKDKINAISDGIRTTDVPVDLNSVDAQLSEQITAVGNVGATGSAESQMVKEIIIGYYLTEVEASVAAFFYEKMKLQTSDSSAATQLDGVRASAFNFDDIWAALSEAPDVQMRRLSEVPSEDPLMSSEEPGGKVSGVGLGLTTVRNVGDEMDVEGTEAVGAVKTGTNSCTLPAENSSTHVLGAADAVEPYEEPSKIPERVAALRGWTVDTLKFPREFEWRDKRICCFCHAGPYEQTAPANNHAESIQIMCSPCNPINKLKIATIPVSEFYDDSHLSGRMVSLPDGNTSHLNCLRWSSDVVEKNGILHDWHKAVDRAPQLACAYCGIRGATVGCQLRKCSRTFHLKCAVAAQCFLFEAKLVRLY